MWTFRSLRRGGLRVCIVLIAVSSCVTIYVAMSTRLPYLTVFRQGDSRDSHVPLELLDSRLQVYNHTGPTGMEPPDPGNLAVLRLKGRRVPLEDSRAEDAEVVDMDVALRIPSWHKLVSAIKDAETVMFPWKLPRMKRVDCGKLYQEDPAEMKRAQSLEQQPAVSKMADKTVATLASNCASFQKMFGFISSSLTEEERAFPLAYSMLVFKEAEQVVSLLRAIYRPQNFYCVHVDKKSKGEFKEAVSAVTACFPNVFIASRSVDVRWGQFTVLEPELICMQDLWHYKQWKYFINLTGQEFPLRTNYELVKILTAFRGANNMEATRKRANVGRWHGRGTPPWGISPSKGSVHILVNRDFVDFVLHTNVSQDFIKWVKNVSIPDETFFSSLNHNPHLGIRGTYNGTAETHPKKYPFLTRFKNWGNFPFNYTCASGKRVRQICILSSGDLPLLDTRRELFANKFYAEKSRVALDCLGERIFNRTRDQYLGHVDFDASYYAGMPFVKNMVEKSSFKLTF